MFRLPAPSRRQVLSGACAALGGMVTTMVGRMTLADEDRGDWIDAHSHIWTREVSRYPLLEGKTVEDLSPASFTTEELLATAVPVGVRRVVLIGHTQYYGFDNRYLIDAAAEHPGVFKVVALIDDRQPDPDKLMRKLLAQHVSGFRITPSIRGPATWLDNDGMRSMWRCASETGQAMCCLINPSDLQPVDAMCKRFPDTTVVIDHFARIGVDGVIRSSELDALCHLAKHPKVHVKISAFYALGRKQPPYDDLIPMIRRVYDAFGAQRLMWASDSPYQLVGDHTYRSSLELVRDKLDFVSATDREWLLRGTAERVYFSD